jgi:putative Holliday junction resolvase
MPESGPFLAFDYGERRIGVAIGNPWSGTARPLHTLGRRDSALWDDIKHLIDEWQPQALVIGMPYQYDGAEQAITSRVRHFANELGRRFNLSVHPVDERWTSSDAASRLRDARRSGAKNRRMRKGDDDALAAQRILQDYLGRCA